MPSRPEARPASSCTTRSARAPARRASARRGAGGRAGAADAEQAVAAGAPALGAVPRGDAGEEIAQAQHGILVLHARAANRRPRAGDDLPVDGALVGRGRAELAVVAASPADHRGLVVYPARRGQRARVPGAERRRHRAADVADERRIAGGRLRAGRGALPKLAEAIVAQAEHALRQGRAQAGERSAHDDVLQPIAAVVDVVEARAVRVQPLPARRHLAGPRVAAARPLPATKGQALVLAPAVVRDVDPILHPGGREGARVRSRVPALADRSALGCEHGARPPVAHSHARVALRLSCGRRGAGHARGDRKRDDAGTAVLPLRRGLTVGGGEQRRDRQRAGKGTRAPDATDLHIGDGRAAGTAVPTSPAKPWRRGRVSSDAMARAARTRVGSRASPRTSRFRSPRTRCRRRRSGPGVRSLRDMTPSRSDAGAAG